MAAPGARHRRWPVLGPGRLASVRHALTPAVMAGPAAPIPPGRRARHPFPGKLPKRYRVGGAYGLASGNFGVSASPSRKGTPMSLVHLVEIDGQRHDITHLEIIEEHRCNGCGEFIKESDRYTVDAVVTTPDGRGVEIGMDFHQNHIYQMGASVLKAVNDTPPF